MENVIGRRGPIETIHEKARWWGFTFIVESRGYSDERGNSLVYHYNWTNIHPQICNCTKYINKGFQLNCMVQCE